MRSICQLLERDGTTITYHAACNDARILADAFYFKLIFTNLIENAIRYANGQVAVSIKAYANEVEVVVADNGPGIPKDLEADIFKPFIRGNQSDKQGFGLGLAIVKRIADWHQVKLTVGKSETLGGAEIALTVKLAE